MAVILRDRVVRLRAPLISDAYNNHVRDWGQATSVIYPASIGPVGTDEQVVDEQRTVSRWRILLPAAADVEAADRLIWDGVTYEIDGDVQTLKRRGRPHHREAVLIKVTQG